MAVKVLEVELTQPFPNNLQELDIKHYTHLQILVRKDSQPLGYCWIAIQGKYSLEEATIREQIAQQLSEALKQPTELFKSIPSDYQWPSVTVAICTRERPQSLERALQSLTNLNYPESNLEVLVVDNAPTSDATRLVVAKFPCFRYTLEPCPGLDWARNRAIQEANGEIIAYTDDDVEVDSLWVRAIARHFENPAVMCVTGLVAPAERETEAQNLFEEYNNGFGKGFEVRHHTMETKKYWRYWPLGAGNFGTGANMAYRKSLFDKIGRFDEALDVGTPTHGAGDLDMFYRTVRADFVLVYEPSALIWHYHRDTYIKLRNQIRDFGRGVYAFWTKTVLTDKPMRLLTLQFAIIWFWQGFVKQLFSRKGQQRRLKIAETIGVFQGPLSYFQARKQAEQLRKTSVASKVAAVNQLGQDKREGVRS